MKALFTNIEQEIISNINSSTSEIKIAVAWFNNEKIFNILLGKCKLVEVSLLIENDANNSSNNLNFQSLIDLGGKIYLLNDNSLMHHKYFIIDKSIIGTGSYNWTYSAENKNEENIILSNDKNIVNQYLFNFNELIMKSDCIDSFVEQIQSNKSKIENVIGEKDNHTYSGKRIEVNENIIFELIHSYNTGQIDKGIRLLNQIDLSDDIENDNLFMAAVLLFLSDGQKMKAEENYKKIKRTMPYDVILKSVGRFKYDLKYELFEFTYKG